MGMGKKIKYNNKKAKGKRKKVRPPKRKKVNYKIKY